MGLPLSLSQAFWGLFMLPNHYQNWAAEEEMSSYGTVATPPAKPDSFQDVTPGPLSYGSTTTPKGKSGERGWLPESTPASRCLASVEATITEQGTRLGIRNPVALFVGTGCAALVVLVMVLSRGWRPGGDNEDDDDDERHLHVVR